jgi:signal transduction histidine kinase
MPDPSPDITGSAAPRNDSLSEQVLQLDRLAELGRLAASIAHEINNPLAVVAYALELMLRDAEMTPFQQEMAARIEQEIERLRNLTGGLLSFSSDRKGLRRLVNLNDLVEELHGLLRFELQRHAVRLDMVFAELPLVAIDPSQVKQVIINLVMNAAQAMQGEGVVTLRTAVLAGTEVELAISDTGPGVPAELRERIFTPFFTTKPEGEGTGLGLYICRNIVIEHGGTLLVDDAPGGGARFFMRLPVPCES